MKKVSLKDIAASVGVSTALVSYVLNNRHTNRIGKEVAQKIREAAAAMNYRGNLIARSLKTNKTQTIGLVVANIANPFFSALAKIVEEAAGKAGYMVIFGSSDEQKEKAEKLVQVLLDRQVDGLVITPTEDSGDLLRRLEESGVPFVLVDRYFPLADTSWVVIDNREASRTATGHLLRNGYRRIGMITYETGLLNLRERERGYEEALAGAGLESNIGRVGSEETAKDVHTILQQWFSGNREVDAILFASNLLSTYGLKYLNAQNIRVPHDVAIVSFDESDAAELFYAPLTHIRQPLAAMGEKAVQILLRAIEGDKLPVQVMEKAELVIGKSSLPKGSE